LVAIQSSPGASLSLNTPSAIVIAESALALIRDLPRSKQDAG
jgi:hypothetical protein